jgi:hypothetical protein
VKLSNIDGNWPVGALTQAQIKTATKDFPLLVPKSAIQQCKQKKTFLQNKETNISLDLLP